MIVADVELHRVALPLRHRFQTSSHSKTFLEHILVVIRDPDGREGWGEIASPSDPYYCSETTETTWLIATRYLIPAILGREFDGPEAVERAWATLRGHHFAKAGFSIAAWDWFASADGVSLAGALGGERTTVEAGVSLGVEPTIDALLEEVERQVASGYRRVKLKIMPGWDVEPVRAVRAAFPDRLLHVDANGAYPGDAAAIEHLASLDGLGLTMIEQPFAPRDFVSSAALQARIGTPVCLDESVDDVEDLATMLALDAGRVLNIKVSRMGGLAAARAAHDLASASGIPVWCGGMHEFGVGRAANLAISSLPGFTMPSDVSASEKYYERDVIVPPVVADHGTVVVPTGAGLGFEIDRAWIAENTRDRVVASTGAND